MNKANKKATVQEEFKAYSVVWECNKGHKNFQTIIGKEGTQHDICLKCGEHYQYQVANGVDTRTEPELPIQSVVFIDKQERSRIQKDIDDCYAHEDPEENEAEVCLAPSYRIIGCEYNDGRTCDGCKWLPKQT